jgi:hypothetical protein
MKRILSRVHSGLTFVLYNDLTEATPWLMGFEAIRQDTYFHSGDSSWMIVTG